RGLSTPSPTRHFLRATATAAAAATAATAAAATAATAATATAAATTAATTAAPLCCSYFDTWLDDLQVYLLSDSRDSVSLFDHTSSAAPAPPATADSATRSQWLTRNAAARLAIRNHLPLAECAHFGQHRTTQTLYDAVVARYSSPAIAALGRLLLPYLFPELSAFAKVEELEPASASAEGDCYRCVPLDPGIKAAALDAGESTLSSECALGTDILEDSQEEFECLAAAVPHFPCMLLAPEGDPDAPDIPTPRSYAEAITVPYSSKWQAAMDAEMASQKSTGTYVDEVSPPWANIVDGMWIFRVKRLSGSPPAFKARYVARGFSLQQGVNYFQTFSPTPKMTTLRVLLHITAHRDNELHSLDFSTAFCENNKE
ncbi:unnamed protein product, partial [Closterium sp. NIES-54]